MTEKPSPLTAKVQLASGADADYFLTFENEDGSFLVYPLDKPVMSVGRTPECDITISDPGISSVHAEFRRGPRGNLELIDLQSSNGTLVNGLATQRALLRGGERIEFGPFECSLESRDIEVSVVANEPDAEQTQAAVANEAELVAVREQLAAAQQELAEIAELNGTRESLQQQLSELETLASSTKSRYDRTLSELQALGPLMDEAKKSKADLESTCAKLDQARQQLDELLKDTGEARLVLSDLEQQCAQKKDQVRELDRLLLEKHTSLNSLAAGAESAAPGLEPVPHEKAS